MCRKGEPRGEPATVMPWHFAGSPGGSPSPHRGVVAVEDGRVLDLGSFRWAGGVLSDVANRQTGTTRYDSMDFYLGTCWVSRRADLTPVYATIFRRLLRRGLDGIYHFPRLYAVDLRPLKEALDQEQQHAPEWLNGSPCEALAPEEEYKTRDRELAESAGIAGRELSWGVRRGAGRPAAGDRAGVPGGAWTFSARMAAGGVISSDAEPDGDQAMSATMSIDEAQAKLKDLIHRLAPGEEVIITENQQTVARLVGAAPQPKPGLRPPPGLGKGFITVLPDDDEHLRDFSGEVQ
jgi:antitoxin (DNA-binding transcriptional repressor) of toxin-antitoxin stability system